MSEWKEIGCIGVDAGLCWVGDPCYIMGKDASSHPCETWKDFCDQLHAKGGSPQWHQWNYPMGHSGLGVTVQTGYGDGEYPVSVRLNSDGRVAAVKVEFIPEETDENS